MVQNKSISPLSIAYSHNIQSKFGDEFSPLIKVKGYEGRKVDEPIVWNVESG